MTGSQRHYSGMERSKIKDQSVERLTTLNPPERAYDWQQLLQRSERLREVESEQVALKDQRLIESTRRRTNREFTPSMIVVKAALRVHTVMGYCKISLR